MYTLIKTLDESVVGKEILVRARVFANRPAGEFITKIHCLLSGNLCFILLRQGLVSVQCVLAKERCPKAMITFASKLICCAYDFSLALGFPMNQ